VDDVHRRQLHHWQWRGTIDVVRPTGPMAISNIGFQDTSVSPVIEYNLGPVLTEDGYAAIAQKALTSVYPQNGVLQPDLDGGTRAWCIPYPMPDQHHAARVIYVQTPVAELRRCPTPLPCLRGIVGFYGWVWRKNCRVPLMPPDA
jgi:hypothetical protein